MTGPRAPECRRQERTGRRGGDGDEPGLAQVAVGCGAVPADGVTPQPAANADLPATPAAEMAALVRSLPPVIAAARARAGDGPLTLAFGRSLEVDLRSVPSGVTVVLRPEARLLAAAEAELPRVVEALQARGVPVARAEVAARGGGRRPR